MEIANSNHRLVLGTAQFGMTYGIANQNGRPDPKKVKEIIQEAWVRGVGTFDTAQGYGNAENVLGEVFKTLGIGKDARVISKFSHYMDHMDTEVMNAELEKSLDRIGIHHFWGMMLHSESLIPLWEQGLRKIFQGFIDKGKVKRVGISVYTPENAINALQLEGIDFVQIPGNIFDRRFEKKGVFDMAEKLDKRVHIRSIFLQGLMLMPIDSIPSKMNYVKPYIEKLIEISSLFGLSREALAMGFVKQAYSNSHILFGVESLSQIRENLSHWENEIPGELVTKVLHLLKDVPNNITNWNLWPK